MFSVNVLLYGDYLPLAQRCLKSIVESADWSLIEELRIGCNAIGLQTQCWLPTYLARVPVPWLIYQEQYNRNVLKYPLMRRMLHDPEHPVKASHLVWLDDDSWIDKDLLVQQQQAAPWWRCVRMVAQSCVLLGSLYYPKESFLPSQYQGLEAQPWYTGKPLRHPYRTRFATGGFWVCLREVFDRWDWPTPFLRHNNGDVLLGELCRQQDYPIKHFRGGVRINANDKGEESKAKRRGATTGPAFVDWQPGDQPDPKLHDFRVAVTVGQCRG